MRCSCCNKEFGNGSTCQNCGMDRVTGLGQYNGYTPTPGQYNNEMSGLTEVKKVVNIEPQQTAVCHYCSEIIPSDSKYCPFCGCLLAEACPQCGHTYSTQYPCCPQCGTNRKDYLRWLEEERKEKKRREREEKKRQKQLEKERKNHERQVELAQKERIEKLKLLVEETRPQVWEKYWEKEKKIKVWEWAFFVLIGLIVCLINLDGIMGYVIMGYLIIGGLAFGIIYNVVEWLVDEYYSILVYDDICQMVVQKIECDPKLHKAWSDNRIRIIGERPSGLVFGK